MDDYLLSQKIQTQINKASNILLVAHQNPDADCLGSIFAFGQWLDNLGKNHLKFCLNQPPANLTWLLNFQPLVTNPNKITRGQFDLVIVLDSGDLKYAGVDKILSDFLIKPFIINIDHHATNQYFGDINLVDAQAVSTTEIIYKIFKSLKIKIDYRLASALLAGIIYDTYNFTNPNTSYQSLETASELLLAGASLPHVNESILKNKNIATLKIWGEILIRLNYNPEFGIVTTVVTNDDLKNQTAEAEVTEGVANFLNNLTGVKAALILQQQDPDTIKGSLRTNDGLIDVSKLAKILGGGGHRKASGFKIKGELVKTESGQWQVE